MLLTISTTHQPATDLGYLLHKHPERTQNFDLSFGKAHVFYPDVSDELCTAALLLDVDPIGLVRGRRAFSLSQYVNDRPYVTSSFMSVAIARVLGSALAGRSNERAALVTQEIPLEVSLSALPARGGEEILRRLFEPLGYQVEIERHVLDPTFPDWGESRYFSVALRADLTLRDLLRHLYVLIPVLDDTKHYWIGPEEVEKLLDKGEGWLAGHPERELIARRYLGHHRRLAQSALSQLVAAEAGDIDREAAAHDAEEEVVEERVGLHQLRLGAVLAALKASGAKSVLDVGCGEGKLLRLLMKENEFRHITGMDVSVRSLERAKTRLRLDRLPTAQRVRIQLMHGSLMYRDERLAGFEAAAVVEVVEHLDPARLRAFERVLFEFAAPATVVLTTPNREYNTLFESLPAGQFRHRDHRFEWTRDELQAWGDRVADSFGYRVRYLPIGPEHSDHGAPSQMAVFTARGGCHRAAELEEATPTGAVEE